MLEKVPIKFKHATALWEPHSRHEPIEYDEGDIIDSKSPSQPCFHSIRNKISYCNVSLDTH